MWTLPDVRAYRHKSKHDTTSQSMIYNEQTLWHSLLFTGNPKGANSMCCTQHCILAKIANSVLVLYYNIVP